MQVLSGTAGFKLVFGEERDIATAQSGGQPPDRFEATVLSGGFTLAEQVVPIAYQPPLPTFDDLPPDAPLDSWLVHEPLAVLGEREIENGYEAHPDETRWYAGRDDLSAVAWLRDTGEGIDLIVTVRDDAASLAENATAEASVILQHDALQVTGFVADRTDSAFEIHLGPTDDGHSRYTSGQATADNVRLDVEQLFPRDDGFRYLYRVRLDGPALAPAALNFTVFDADGPIAKQTLTSATTSIIRRR